MTSILQHLKDRHFDYSRHVVYVSESDRVATFPLWNMSGQMVGYQRYAPDKNKVKMNHPTDGRYFTYRKAECWVPWGLESYYWDNGPIFVSEGIFDACRLTEFGKTALAVMTNKPPVDFLNFVSFLTRPVVVVLDNDSAGKKLARFGDYVEITPEKDLGDSSDEYIQYLINKYFVT